MQTPQSLADTPLVSVVVRSMDRPTLAQALASIAAQSWPAIEVLVIAACGLAHGPVASCCGPFPVRIVQHGTRLQRSAAANAGIEAAQGQWVIFLDDDDWFDPSHVEGLARRLMQEPQAVAAYAGVRCVAPVDGALREIVRYHFEYDRGRLLFENYLPINSVLFGRAAALSTGGFDTSFDVFEDWDFWLQLSRQGQFARVDQVSAVYRLGSGDSGLLGNTALQEETAARILGKWLPSWSRSDVEALWRSGRSSLQQQARLAAQLVQHEAAAAQQAELVRHRDLQIEERDEAISALKLELGAQLQVAREAEMQLSHALQATTREYENAMRLLRHEQTTVLKPVARRIKRLVKPVYDRMPAPLKRLARRLVRGTQARMAQLPIALPTEPEVSIDWRARLAGARDDLPTVIVFPVIDWHFRIQRPQHLARELARRGHRVLYVSTTFAPGSGPGACRLVGSPAPNLHLLQLALAGTPPNIYEDALSEAQAESLAGTLAWLQRQAGLGALVSLVNLPFWRPVASRLPANLMVYDCMDWHAGFSTNTGRMLEEEHALLQGCDLLLTSSLRLSELMQAKAPGKPHALVRNGTEVAHFANVPPALKLQTDGRTVIGYFGAISEWFDMPMVVAAARARPGWRFVLVGSTAGCDVSEAQRLPNLEFIGEVPYAELPGWVHAFDVCTIPFILNELTSCTNPVKVYEYLSAGKPVVATRMPELVAIEDQVFLAQDAEDFVRQLDRALQEGRGTRQAAARRDWAGQHSWAARADTLDRAIGDCLPKASVVVLCFNNLELTKACLASVERNSLWPRLELVVVDNASSDGTADWLREFAASRPWVKLVLNERNLGFAAGNNVGLAAATGDILIMLNNDTQVSPGWIHGLWRHLAQDASLGMVGPVTNNIGNEAKVQAGYDDTADMPAWAAARAVQMAGRQHECRVLAFFCVALRRVVYEKVGGLDEAFGLGFFEDDDYCNRVRQAGWHLAIADDVFVHHHLSASFDKLKAATRQQLFEKNRAIYESKWGPWVPHQYRKPEPHP